MEVYIEYVIIDNFLLDFLLLKLALVKKRTSIYKGGLYYGSAIGTLVAIILPLVKMPTILLLIIKTFLGIIMLLCSANFHSFKELISAYIRFLVLTFAFGGAIYAILGFFKIDYAVLYKSYSMLPVGLIILFAVILYKAFYKFICSLYESHLIYPFVRECELMIGDKRMDVTGLIDTGNQLIYDDFYSVCIAGERLVKRLEMGGFLGEETGRIEVKTVSGKCEILLYRFDRIKIYYNGKVNIIERPLIGIGEKQINLSEEYDLILSAEYAKGERYERDISKNFKKN